MNYEYFITDDDDKDFFIINNTWDVNDERFGSQHSICNVCGSSKLPSNYTYIKNTKEKCICTGHFGKIDLLMYIVHPLFTSLYKKICKDFKIKKSLPLKEQRDLFPKQFRGIIFRYLPFPHLNIRDSSDSEWNNQLTHLYKNLVNIISNIDVVNITPSCMEKVEKCVKKIFSKDGVLGLLSTKQGVFRKMCFGKRLESSARSVIIGEPGLDFDQVYIPKYLAKFLYIECIIENEDWEYFFEKDMPLTKDQKIIGIKALRKIKNDDLVLINRQPTLSYGSILAFRAKLRKDDIKTIGINPNVTKTFNADFDGDEMNIFCFPQCADLEKMHIANFPESVSSIQDTVTATFIFNTEPINKIGTMKSVQNNTEKNKQLYEDLTRIGLSISLRDMLDLKYENTDLSKMIDSKSKGNLKNKEQIMQKVGKQFVSGNFIGNIQSNYLTGLNPDEFFLHQMAAREGIVSTGVSTSSTGYVNRKTTRSMADVVLTDETFTFSSGEEKKVIRDYKGIISFQK